MLISVVKINKVKKGTLFNTTRQYKIHIFNTVIFFKYRTRQIKTTETSTVVKLLILFETAT